MVARHRLDIDLRTLLYGVLASLRPWHRADLEKPIKAAFPRSEELLVCLSVRSGFELLLDALALPGGSEAVVSAVTHPDMVSLLEAHGVRVVPVDLDTETLEPRLDQVEKAIGPETRLVVVAHLFGTRVPLLKLAELARSTGVLLVEDCAQSFRGPWADADSAADVSMYSFGTIKTATALGGAVLWVRDARLRARMERLQEDWPAQSRAEYLVKSVRSLMLRALGGPATYWLVFHGSALLGADLERVIRFSSRGFGTSADEPRYWSALRRRPSKPLLAVLARRTSSFDVDRFERRVLLGERLQRSLPETLAHPGARAEIRTHWLFPIVSPDPQGLRAHLAASGFDASPATSAIGVVRAPPESPELEPRDAARMMEQLLFVPLYPELSEQTIDRLAAALTRDAELGANPVPELAGSMRCAP